VFVQILNVLAEDLYTRGQIDLAECFIDGTFVPAKKGAPPSAKQAWQREQDHGNSWPSYRHSRIECFAA